MSSSEIDILLKELSDKKSEVFAGEIPDAPKAQEIVSALNSISAHQKPLFKEFAKTLKDELFKSNVQINGLDLSAFEEVHAGSPVNDAENSKYNEVQTEFSELIKNLIANLRDHFEILKGYFILKLENSPIEPYKLLVLHDATFFIQPIKKILESKFPGSEIITISDYQKAIDKGNVPTNNILCLLLLNPRPNDGDSITSLNKSLEVILGAFKSFENFSINDLKDLKGEYYSSSNSKEDFFEEIEFMLSTFLSNGLIPHEEEKMIKKIFKNFQTPLLIYKTLKGGNSGSKVIEVRPKKEFGNQHEKRYIVKYSKKTMQRKIETERKCFGKWIEGYKGFREYECEYAKTLAYEAIRYSYAISETETESFSFNEILTKADNKFHGEKKITVEKLFEIELFNRWQDSKEQKEVAISDLYADYVKPEKIFTVLGKMLNKSEAEMEQTDLFKNFKKIWKYKGNFSTKVCHGDLHSENFFRDNNGVYLIDFGYTGIRHSLIDHTSLECSIKFKHIPYYTPISELIEIEKEMLLSASFQLSGSITKTSRNNLIELLEVVRYIRHDSMKQINPSANNAEYLISLFLMTFRQIQYQDMNQLYAYHSAELLGTEVVKLLGL